VLIHPGRAAGCDAGKTSATAGDTPPEGCVMAFRTARQSRGSAPLPSVYHYNGKDYPRDLLEDIIAREDGYPSPSSQGGGPACTELKGGTRKTRHFFARLCGIFSMDDMKSYILQSKLQLAKKELDERKTGPNAELWRVAAARYSDVNLSVGGCCILPWTEGSKRRV